MTGVTGFPLIADALRGLRFELKDEVRLQEQMAEAFQAKAVPFMREWPLTPLDRPDFLVGTDELPRIAVEVKVGRAWSRMRIYRQLERYAAHHSISALLLVTVGRYTLPPEINGKPARVLNLGAAWL